MSKHDYTAERALDVLLRKLREHVPDLAFLVQSAIDAGKDVEEKESLWGRRKKPRVYRKTVRLTDEEALHVVLDALQAHFVEQSLFAASATENFRAAAVAPQRSGSLLTGEKPKAFSISREGVGLEKILEIELQPETQISKADQETLRLEVVPNFAIQEEQENVKRLRDLIRFSEA
jgi:hypothetical protein